MIFSPNKKLRFLSPNTHKLEYDVDRNRTISRVRPQKCLRKYGPLRRKYRRKRKKKKKEIMRKVKKEFDFEFLEKELYDRQMSHKLDDSVSIFDIRNRKLKILDFNKNRSLFEKNDEDSDEDSHEDSWFSTIELDNIEKGNFRRTRSVRVGRRRGTKKAREKLKSTV